MNISIIRSVKRRASCLRCACRDARRADSAALDSSKCSVRSRELLHFDELRQSICASHIPDGATANKL
jgi:hypothetical protein